MERTKHRHKFNPLPLLLGVFICSLAAVPANADHIVSILTNGGYGLYGDNPLLGEFQGYSNNGSYIYGYLALHPANWQQTQYTQCDQYFDCVTTYWGNYTGGTGTVTVYLPNSTAPLTLNATGIGGSFYGQMGDFCIQGCFDWYEYGDFVFSGYWSNGWHSAFSAGYTWDFYFATNGGLGITTQTTPEPSSIALLGSGVLGLIGYGRKHLGR